MAKYRKKPVVIEAAQWLTLEESFAEMSEFIETGVWGINANGVEMFIITLEGKMTASPGDWIIKGVKGEFYPCKPDIFEATYEAI